MKKIKIIDTTLRDGSYAINFNFTLEQNTQITQGLDECGIEYIEVGHGVGLNASNMGFGQALHSDKDYISSAAKAVKKAKIGVFCIPNIAKIDDINLAADCGIKFIRIGTNVTETQNSEKYIKRAKSLGLEVFANYMKSYCLEPSMFAEKVISSESFGADGVYIVDSAGGMMKKDIELYYKAIRKVSNIPVGFHAHDNLGLAIANNLECVDMGLDFVDTSLQGLGRSAGNASTEIMIMTLLKKGIKLNIDYLKLQEVGHKLVTPLLRAVGKEPLDTISGFADFHSSYMGHIKKYSSLYKINPLKLIIEYAKYDRINLNEAVMDDIAKNIKDNQVSNLNEYDFTRYFGNEQI